MIGNLLFCCLFVLILTTTHADKVYWANWSSTPITEAGIQKYVGTIHVPNEDNELVEVTIKFSSDKPINFIQSGTGTDYWKSGSANSPYVSSTIDNDPPASSVVSLRYTSTNTFEFSQPLGNVFLAYISINGNTFSFNRDFEILSNGVGYWGQGTVVHKVVGDVYQLQTTSGDPHGTVGLEGEFDAFSFKAEKDENWFGFQIGTHGLSSVVYPTKCPDLLDLIPKPKADCVRSTLALNEENSMNAQKKQEIGSGGGLSSSMMILVAVLSAVGTSVLVIGVTALAGYYYYLKKGNNLPVRE